MDIPFCLVGARRGIATQFGRGALLMSTTHAFKMSVKTNRTKKRASTGVPAQLGVALQYRQILCNSGIAMSVSLVANKVMQMDEYAAMLWRSFEYGRQHEMPGLGNCAIYTCVLGLEPRLRLAECCRFESIRRGGGERSEIVGTVGMGYCDSLVTPSI